MPADASSLDPILQQTLIAEWIGDRHTGGFVNLTGMMDDLGLSESVAHEALRELAARDWLQIAPDGGGVDASGVLLLPEGVSAVRALKVARDDQAARAVACRRGLLRWLYTFTTTLAVCTAFQGSGYATYLDGSFTDAERDAGLRHLRDLGFVEGMEADSGTIPRPRLTATGRECVEDAQGDVRAYRAAQHAGGISVVGNHNAVGSGNATGHRSAVVSQSPGATVALNAHDFASQLDELERSLTDLALPASDTEDVEEALGDLRAEAKSLEPNHRKMRVLLKGLKNIALGSAPIAIGNNAPQALETAVHQTDVLLHMLGVG